MSTRPARPIGFAFLVAWQTPFALSQPDQALSTIFLLVFCECVLAAASRSSSVQELQTVVVEATPILALP